MHICVFEIYSGFACKVFSFYEKNVSFSSSSPLLPFSIHFFFHLIAISVALKNLCTAMGFVHDNRIFSYTIFNRLCIFVVKLLLYVCALCCVIWLNAPFFAIINFELNDAWLVHIIWKRVLTLYTNNCRTTTSTTKYQGINYKWRETSECMQKVKDDEEKWDVVKVVSVLARCGMLMFWCGILCKKFMLTAWIMNRAHKMN